MVRSLKPSVLISLNAYQLLEDAWLGGVEAWCRAASGFVLKGGHAWMVTASDGQANWIKRRLLTDGVSLFGVQFLDARSLRRELCQRYDLPARAIGQETLEFLLRSRALAAAEAGSPRCAAIARHPGTCLAALDDYAGAGWLHEPGLLDDILPDELADWLPELQQLGAWTPEIDRRLREVINTSTITLRPLTVCVFGWDAACWAQFELLQAAVRAADAAYVFTPSPRGTSEGLQQGWLEACEEAFDTSFETCESAGFISAQSALAGRLEGTDLDAPGTTAQVPAPELLTGVDGEDTATLVVDFAARWLTSTKEDGASGRLAVMCPRRSSASVAVVRALTAVGISVEDESGEIAEPTLTVQIQRAILEYQQDRGGLDGLLNVVELLNQHVNCVSREAAPVLHEICPLDPVEVRRALHQAFAEVQHHDARALSEAASFARSATGKPLRQLIRQLEAWPETLSWKEALQRWCEGLAKLGISINALEPLWSQLQHLAVPDPVPAMAFFHYLSTILAGTGARRSAGASRRFAKVVITTLEGAAGQTWGGVVLLDSNEGSWPLYPPENPFFDDAMRKRFNTRRAAMATEDGKVRPHHLLTSADRAQLEHFKFLEALENCTGPLAFASQTRDDTETSRELYPNEWLLRCLVESSGSAESDEPLLERWRRSARQVMRKPQSLSRKEEKHLREVHHRRRDPDAGFDEHFFNFLSLTGPDELPWAEAWSARDLDTAWNQPATFAMAQVFGAEPWREKGRGLIRGESWMVGRLVHQWVLAALGLSKAARRFTADDWRQALGSGLSKVRVATEEMLRHSLSQTQTHAPDNPRGMDLWWDGVLRRATWAAYHCLEALAETASSDGQAERWLSVERNFRTELSTSSGPLRLRARCDLVLLDRPEIGGAVCQLIDIRTGAAPGSGPLTLAKMQTGKGLGLAALLFMARAEGSDALHTQAGVIHPDSSNFSLVDHASAPMLETALDILARQQHTLTFGQKGGITDESGHGQVENLPLATTPIDPTILALKAQRTGR